MGHPGLFLIYLSTTKLQKREIERKREREREEDEGGSLIESNEERKRRITRQREREREGDQIRDQNETEKIERQTEATGVMWV